jgi:hypothetical protein
VSDQVSCHGRCFLPPMSAHWMKLGAPHNGSPTMVGLNGTTLPPLPSIPPMMITTSSPICMRDSLQSITAVHTMPGRARPRFSRVESDQVWTNTQILASSIARTSSTLCAATPCTFPRREPASLRRTGAKQPEIDPIRVKEKKR